MSANWAALKAQIAPSGTRMRPRKAAEPEDTAKAPEAIAATQGVTPVLAVDCEMVGAGPEGARSLLARCATHNVASLALAGFPSHADISQALNMQGSMSFFASLLASTTCLAVLCKHLVSASE